MNLILRNLILKEHKEHTYRIEQKFFEEKMRLQIEANKKIEELAEKAHDAAVKFVTFFSHPLSSIFKNISTFYFVSFPFLRQNFFFYFSHTDLFT